MNCQSCGGEEFDEEDNCVKECFPPEGYVRPGSETLMYVNAYRVTRHFGGREEGGWWYNHSEPLASIPVKAVSHEHHDSLCWTCSEAARGCKSQLTGETYKPCKWGFHLIPNQEQVAMFKAHLESIYEDVKEGDIYSVLGGAELDISVEDHPGESEPRPHYE